MSKCNCGGKFTSFPSVHSPWCDVMKQTSATVINNFGMMKFKKIEDGLIKVIYKPDNMDFGRLDYTYSRGEFKSGIYNGSVHTKDFRPSVLKCIEFLVDAINDDRMPEWRKETAQARKVWEEENEPPPIDLLELE